MLYLIVMFFLVMVLIYFPHIRNVVLHPFLSFRYFIMDFFCYFRYKKYNNCKFYGKIIAYCSDNSHVFGCGKTLTAVYEVIRQYIKYDGKKVWDKEQKRFVKQNIKILSNVHFKPYKKLFKSIIINYEFLTNADQITNLYKSLGPCDVGIVVVDETSSLWNSRNFKDNFSPDMIKSMSTCRHTHFGMILTAPRFNQIDALMRQICSEVHMCSKMWRSEVVKVVSAYEMEYVTNLKYIKSYMYRYFIKNSLYNAYDTDAMVEELERQVKSGERLSSEEILEAQGTDKGTYFNVGGTRKFKKLLKGS